VLTFAEPCQLPTWMYYWRIVESGYGYPPLTSFNTVVLKRSGLADKYLFQESDILAIEKESKDTERYFYHYYYFPDENEQDIKIEILLPSSQPVHYTDTQYPHIAKEKDLEAIELRIDQFSSVLAEYNILYLEDLDYEPGQNILRTTIGLGAGALCLWGASNEEDDLSKIGYGGLGAFFVGAGIVWGVITIRDALKIRRTRRVELKKLESTLQDIINTN